MYSRVFVCIALAGTLLFAGCHKDPKKVAAQHAASGDRLLADKKTADAIIEYRTAVISDPASGPNRVKLADAYVQAGDIQNAYREYIRAADLMPDDVNAQIKAGRVLVVANQFAEAKSRAEQALRLEPRNVAAQILLGNALAGLKDLNAAVTETEKAISMDSNRSDIYSSLAALQLARGDRQLAEAAFKRAVSTDPKSADARLALANFYWVSSRLPEAEATLKQALALEPENLMVNRALAAFCVRTRRPADAEPYLATVARVTHDPEAIVTLADYYVAMGRTADAKTLLEKLAEDKASYGIARAKLASLAYSESGAAAAHKILDELLQKDPANVQALILSARLYTTERKLDAAIKQGQAAVAADPRSADAHLVLGSAYRQRGQLEDASSTLRDALKADPTAVPIMLQLAELEHMRGNLSAALQFAEQATKNEPRNPTARFVYGEMLVESGEFSLAEEAFRPLAEANPDSAAVHAELARLYLARKDDVAARAALQKAIALDPTYVPALGQMVRLNARTGHARDSVTTIEAVLSKRPDDSRVLLVAAEAYGAAGDLKRQEGVLRRSLELDPGSGQAYAMLGQLYASQHRLAEARQQFEAWSQQNPKAIAPLTMIGLILESENKPGDAEKQYEKILQLDPNAVIASNNLAGLYAERNENLDVALRLAQTARAAAPDDLNVSDTLGWVLYKKGLPQDAIASLEPCVQKEPGNAGFQYHLGMAYAKSGDDAKAVSALKKALSLQPNMPGAGDARKALAELEVLNK
jgi:tetratricopeptide (TPR) repeat protein